MLRLSLSPPFGETTSNERFLERVWYLLCTNQPIYQRRREHAQTHVGACISLAVESFLLPIILSSWPVEPMARWVRSIDAEDVATPKDLCPIGFHKAGQAGAHRYNEWSFFESPEMKNWQRC